MNYREEVEEIISNLGKIPIADGTISVYILRDYLAYDESTKKYHFAISFGRMERASGSVFSEYKEIHYEGFRENRMDKRELMRYVKEVFIQTVDFRKIFITFSHSNGFAINVGDTVVPTAEKQKANKFAFFDGHVQEVVKNDAVGAVPQVKISRLWIADLVDVVNNGLQEGDKIDLLLMVNCNMQLMDTIYQLRKITRVLIASQTQFSYYGFHYLALISTIQKYPDISNRSLADVIVKQFVEKYTFMVSDGRNKLTCNTLFAHDLEYVYQLIELMNNITDYLSYLINIPENRELIKMIRSKYLADVSNFPGQALNLQFIDFGCLINRLAILFSEQDNNIPAMYNDMYRMFIKRMTIAGYVGDDYRVCDEYRTAKYGLTGVSVFFPAPGLFDAEEKVENYLTISREQGFNYVTKWDNFLTKLYTAD